MNPPVTVVSVPIEAGSRGYGCKVLNGDTLLIPYNKSVVDAFDDVIDKRIYTVVRERFFALETV